MSLTIMRLNLSAAVAAPISAGPTSDLALGSGFGADRAVQRVRHHQFTRSGGLGARLLPQRALPGIQQRQHMVLAITPDRAIRLIERDQKRVADQVAETGAEHSPIEAGVGDAVAGHRLRWR